MSAKLSAAKRSLSTSASNHSQFSERTKAQLIYKIMITDVHKVKHHSIIDKYEVKLLQLLSFKRDPQLQNMPRNVRLRCIRKSLRISKKLENDFQFMNTQQTRYFVDLSRAFLKRSTFKNFIATILKWQRIKLYISIMIFTE